MAEHSQTPLAYVMDILGISGTALAKSIHIHQSMVSRWKSGAAEFSLSTRYFQDIVQALQAVDREQGYGTLQHFLSSIYGKPMQRQDDIYKHLVMWLTGANSDMSVAPKLKNQGNSLYTAEHKVYKGKQGKANANLFFFETLSTFPAGQTVWQYEPNAATFEKSTAKKMREQHLLLAKNDTRFNLLTCLNQPRSKIFNLYEYWLPICAQTEMQIYYNYDNTPSPFSSINYAEDRLAMVTTNSEPDDPNLYTAIFDDPLTLRQYDTHIQQLKQSYKPLLKYMHGKEKIFDFDDANIAELVKLETDQYAFLDEHFLLTFNRKIIQKVIPELELTPQEEKVVMKFYRQNVQFTNKFIMGQKKTRIILSASLLSGLHQGGKIAIPILSSHLGREIKIPTKYIVQEFYAYLELINNLPNVEIAIQPKDCPPLLEGINLWVKQNAFAYFRANQNLSVRIIVDEFSSIVSLFNAAKQYWQDLPFECKNPEFFTNQITLLIDSN